MKKIATVLVACLLALSAGPAVAEEWKIQTLFAPGTTHYDGFVDMAKKIEKASDGRLVITPLPVGGVVGPTGTMDAVKAGVLDGHFTWPGLWGGVEPGFAAVADLSGAYENASQQIDMMDNWGGADLLAEMYAANGLQTVGVFYNGIEAIPSKTKIASLADLAGLKVRLPPGITSDVFAKFGAAPVVLPLSEAFSALDKGVVDAADAFGLSDNMKQGFYDIAKYTVYPSVHSAPILDFSVSKAKWDALPDDLKKIVQSAAREAMLDILEQRAIQDARAADKLSADGIEIVTWSEEDRSKMRQTAAEVWREFGEKSEYADKAVELQVNYLTSMGLL